ncbi:MAG TPA: thiamine phosphate synthase [Gammaproteobacteria bacterium]|jgi:thiamine-phosphate pyrophosphorylase
MNSPLRGLYAISDGGPHLATAVEAAIRGGARLVQYRDKSADASQRLQEAKVLLELCRGHGVPLIVNDDVALAAETGADGVHLGKDDGRVEDARVRLGPRALIGVSCYGSLERALQAAHDGADYVAFGSFFASGSKPAAVRAPLALLTEARSRISIPLCGIGGITPDNGASLISAGADMLAVIRGVFAAKDVETEARRYAALFKRQ